MTATISKTAKAGAWQVTIRFLSKDEAEDFMEDVTVSKNAAILGRLKKAQQESETKKARPIEQLYRKYGV